MDYLNEITTQVERWLRTVIVFHAPSPQEKQEYLNISSFMMIHLLANLENLESIMSQIPSIET